MTMSRKVLGSFGEDVARRHLIDKGYIVKEQNVRNRMGEIDIVAEDDPYIVFVEVRTRRSRRYGTPLESIDARKQSRIKAAAQLYLIERRMHQRPVRFDVIGVLVEETIGRPTIDHVIDAF